ncbi:MAG: hypothetical protein R3F54_31435 [Alphaproteobacteria bacterium]
MYVARRIAGNRIVRILEDLVATARDRVSQLLRCGGLLAILQNLHRLDQHLRMAQEIIAHLLLERIKLHRLWRGHRRWLTGAL